MNILKKYPKNTKNNMKKEELIQKLKAINEKVNNNTESNEYYDQENAHLEADNLIIEYIDDKEIQEAYDNIGKWYA